MDSTDVPEQNSNNYQITTSREIHNQSNTETVKNTFYSNKTIFFCNETCSFRNKIAKSCSFTSKHGSKILYSFLILSFYSLYSTTYRFFDFTSLNVAKQHNSEFGNERFFGFLGSFVVTILCNFVLNIDKSGTRAYYDNVFWFAVVLLILSLISSCKIENVISPPGLSLTKKSLKMLTDIEIMSVCFVAFFAGTAHTFNHFYHLWFLNSLNASKWTIGIHIMTFSMYGLPIYVTSKWWLRKLERKTIFIISLLGYVINGTCYSFLYYPWLSLIIEMTKAFSLHLLWIALVKHSREIAPEGLAATVNAVVGTIHFGIGRSFSVSVGGYIISTFGARTAYRVLAGSCMMAATSYSMFLYVRNVFFKIDRVKLSKDPEEMKSIRESEA